MATSVKVIKGVSDTRANMLAKLGISYAEDLLCLYPNEYEDRTIVRKIEQLVPGDSVTVTGTVVDKQTKVLKSTLSVLNIVIEDSSSSLHIRFYNQQYLNDKIQLGQEYSFFGKISAGFYDLELDNPAFCKTPVDRNFSGIKPIYPLTKGITQNMLRMYVRNAMQLLPPPKDTLPDDIRDKYKLIGRADAVTNIHFPATISHIKAASHRLKFDELLSLQLMLMLLKSDYTTVKSGISFKLTDTGDIDSFIEKLPYRLSSAQNRVLGEIFSDMDSDKPMNRLVLGDVGCGKTILAELAMLKAVLCGYQAIFMAPTEILAEQHMKNISAHFEPLGIKCCLLTGSLTAKSKKEALSAIENSEVSCIIGTHALIQKNVVFGRPGIVITDEQHRFGVRQRSVLADISSSPDVLIMTATPIPRTLALILYGDLDISRVDEMPSGRKPIQTFVANEQMRSRINKWTLDLISKGQQVYIVYPAIDSEGDDAQTIKVKTAQGDYEQLSKTLFAGISCALIHGKLPAKEKDDIMRRFCSGEIKVLFSTTVIEVGVDVPNSSLIIIENAERFGLAQLHQLRGRVGRGTSQGYCVLFTEFASKGSISGQRMNILKTSTDGSEISAKDLELRGPGDFFGTKQHGLPALKIANLYEDTAILTEAQDAARTVLASPVRYSKYIASIRKQIPGYISL